VVRVVVRDPLHVVRDRKRPGELPHAGPYFLALS